MTPDLYQTESATAVASVLDATPDAGEAVVGVRAAGNGYAVDLTHCTIGGTRYEVDHVDASGRTRTPEEVAAIVKQLMIDHTEAEPEPMPEAAPALDVATPEVAP